jgi:hypothetical protein
MTRAGSACHPGTTSAARQLLVGRPVDHATLRTGCTGLDASNSMSNILALVTLLTILWRHDTPYRYARTPES